MTIEQLYSRITNLERTLSCVVKDCCGVSFPEVITQIGNPSYLLPADTLIQAIVIIDPDEITVSIGTTFGGNEILADQTGHVIISEDQIYKTSDTMIYFTGTTGNSIIKIYTR